MCEDVKVRRSGGGAVGLCVSALVVCEGVKAEWEVRGGERTQLQISKAEGLYTRAVRVCVYMSESALDEADFLQYGDRSSRCPCQPRGRAVSSNLIVAERIANLRCAHRLECRNVER